MFLTGTIAPGLFADKNFTPTTVAFFGFTARQHGGDRYSEVHAGPARSETNAR
jgi:hypothetical protein